MGDNMTKQNTTQQNGALELVVMRNAFYRDNYRRALFVLLLLFITNVVLTGAVMYKWLYPARPQYFATTSDGRLINRHAMSDPVVSDDYVLQWSANAVRRAFSLDYQHWQSQLQSSSIYFTDWGWKYFLQSIKKSNNLETLKKLKMVSSAEITNTPRIERKEVLDGVYAWKVQMSILVTYENINRSIPMPMDVTLIVMRSPVTQSPDRIAINNFLPVAKQSTQQRLFGA